MVEPSLDEIERLACRMGPGVTMLPAYALFGVCAAGRRLCLLLSADASGRDARMVAFPERLRIGDVWHMALPRADVAGKCYAFEIDGVRFADPYGQWFPGRCAWGQGRPGLGFGADFAWMDVEGFDWGDDAAPRIPYEDSIVYRLHVRGFTKHASSGVAHKGTFLGVAEKIPYLLELGVTTLELLPAAEFNEVMYTTGIGGQGGSGAMKPDGSGLGASDDIGAGTGVRGESSGGRSESARSAGAKINFWGYAPAYAYAPKAAYCGPEPREFCSMVKQLHEAGLEVVVELYFTGDEPPDYVLGAMRHWVRDYHVDGIHLVGHAPMGYVRNDPYLSGVKLWGSDWGGDDPGGGDGFGFDGGNAGVGGSVGRTGNAGPAVPGAGARLPAVGRTVRGQGGGAPARPMPADVCHDFLVTMRRFLKGDEGMLGGVCAAITGRAPGRGALKFISHTNGFTLMDMVSYDRKHNEANGERGQDGSDYNYSWNCGVEGPSRKKAVMGLRKRQMRNALVMLFLSQGTPMILAGDEFGQSGKGNNNPYCQDNDITWLNWKLLETNRDLFAFMKFIIGFRRRHRIFSLPGAPQMMDTLACGYPDISFHGEQAWRPEFENYRRELGVLYCGLYAKDATHGVDNTFYVLYNMHWEPHVYSLPRPPRGQVWHLAIDTGDEGVGGFYEQGNEPLLAAQDRWEVAPRTAVVLIGKNTEPKLTNIRQGRKRNETSHIQDRPETESGGAKC